MTRQKNNRLALKYIIRRALIIMMFLAVASGLGWYVYMNQAKPDPADEIVTMPEQAPEPDSEPVSEFAPPSEPESEDIIEPEQGASADDWELLLVNPTNYLPENYSIELETITESYRVDKRISDNVKRMFAQAKQDGINLVICSAYRTFERQQELFDEKEKELMSEGKTREEAVAVTATIIARPGTSEHQTGLALDIISTSYPYLDSGFADTTAFKWLDANAHKFGFVMRYPDDKQDITKIIYEPWHYRYVGEENAAAMKDGGYCLEEYTDNLRMEELGIPDDGTEADSGDIENEADE